MPKLPIINEENILKEEVQKAIMSMKDCKTMGIDEISAEMIKAIDEQIIDAKTQSCNIIYINGHIPTEMEQSIFVTLPIYGRRGWLLKEVRF